MSEALPPCPTCPLCGAPPLMVLGGGTQAFCGVDDCVVLTWNPTLPDGGVADANIIDIPFREDT